MRTAAILLALGALWQQTPSFKSGIQLLEVDARVFDGQGRFVTDLTIDDFEIYEDGRPQKIQTMFLVGGSNAPVPGSDAATSAAAAPRAPQTWIFIFDRKHLMPGGYRR